MMQPFVAWLAVCFCLFAACAAAAQEQAKKEPRIVSIAEAKRLASTGTKELVRVHGTLLYESAEGWFCIHDGTAGIRGQIDAPFSMQPGDLLEITAAPSLFKGAPWFWHSTAKNLGAGTVPAPVALHARQIIESPDQREKLDASLITIAGRVTRSGKERINYDVRGLLTPVDLDTVFINDAGIEAKVRFTPGAALKEPLPAGALVEFTGASRVEQDQRPGHQDILVITVGKPDFARVLEWPPSWQAARYQRWLTYALIALAGCLLAGGIWFWMERRRAMLRLTDERNAELERALKREQELSHLKSRFVSIVSHEFRTPLSIIGSSAEILEHYDAKLAPEQRAEHLRAITENVKRTARMMEDALALSRMDSGGIHFSPAPLDVPAFCRRLCDEMRSATAQRNPIELDCGGGLDKELPLDEALLRHMLTNLISNAVKYSPQAQPVHLRVRRENGCMNFDVQDRGIGIPEGARDRLFEAFHRADNVGEIGGTGLGLVIAKRCCDLHGGRITFESEEGRGTTFHITLPIRTEIP